jgi:glycosyltransferase involved in cell wall biosynthesis
MARGDYSSIAFIESIGLRRPQPTFRDLRRIARRLGRAVRGAERATTPSWRELPPRTAVVSPVVIPLHARSLERLNSRLLRRSVDAASVTPDATRVLWTYSPVTYGLEEDADLVVYHCVDLLGAVPGIDRDLIDRHEKSLAAKGALAIATSEVVRDHLARQGFSGVRLWENVADVERIMSMTVNSTRQPGRAIFAGNLSPTKIDYELIRALCRSGLEVILAGPRAEGGGKDDEQFDSLIAAGAEYVGMLTADELAHEMGKSTVGLIPYVSNAYTRGVSPLKVYEYLAAGLAVVSTQIPGVHSAPNAIWQEGGASSFVDRVMALAAIPSEHDISHRHEVASGHSWLERGKQVRELLDDATRGLVR